MSEFNVKNPNIQVIPSSGRIIDKERAPILKERKRLHVKKVTRKPPPYDPYLMKL